MEPSIISPHTAKAGKNLDDVIFSIKQNYNEDNDYFKVRQPHLLILLFYLQFMTWIYSFHFYFYVFIFIFIFIFMFLFLFLFETIFSFLPHSVSFLHWSNTELFDRWIIIDTLYRNIYFFINRFFCNFFFKILVETFQSVLLTQEHEHLRTFYMIGTYWLRWQATHN